MTKEADGKLGQGELLKLLLSIFAYLLLESHFSMVLD